MSDRDRDFRLSRLDTGAAPQGPVCGETPPMAHNSTAPLYMLTCTKRTHGPTERHENRRGDVWPEVVQRRVDLVPERRR